MATVGDKTDELVEAIRWLLNELRKEEQVTPDDEYVLFEYQANKSAPDREEQRRAVSFLEKRKAIKIKRKKYSHGAIDEMMAKTLNFKPIGFFLEVLQPVFAEICEEFAVKEQSQVSKLKVTFSPQTARLVLAEQGGKEHTIKIQGQVQKEVLRAIFLNPDNTFTEWTLADVSEILGTQDVDETAVKNALYQINKKVQLDTRHTMGLFDVTKHSFKFNPKYIDKT